MLLQAKWYLFPQQMSEVMAVTMVDAGRKSGYKIVEWFRSGRAEQ
jgi:hypothetical protein